MTACILIRGMVTDPPGFAAYARAVSQLVVEMGGAISWSGGNPEALKVTIPTGAWLYTSGRVERMP